MAYLFEESNFKGHLHRNCHRDWFSKSSYNVCCEDLSGFHKFDEENRFYTVNVKETLRDPDLKRGAERAAMLGGIIGGATSGLIGIAAAPFTGGLSLLAMAPATATGFVGGALGRNASEEPEDVYFTLNADNSQWVAQQVSPGTIHNVAYNIGSWSHDVYFERYELRSNTSRSREFQAYIEQRPPTPRI